MIRLLQLVDNHYLGLKQETPPLIGADAAPTVSPSRKAGVAKRQIFASYSFTISEFYLY